jgi:hypothetical protein
MDWKQKLQSARQAGEQILDQKTEKAIEENWPKIQQVFKEKVGPAALAAAKDDEKMQSLFKLVYAALPFPVHLAVKEEAFIKFCFSHRDRLMPTGEAGAGLGQ